MQWMTDLIGYNTTASYGSPAYYAQQMFSTHHGDNVLAISEQGVPTREWTPPAGRGGGKQPAVAPMPQQVPLVFFNATRDSKTGTIYVKVVNRASTAQPVRLAISGTASVQPTGRITTMAANSPEDTNSITEPMKIVPVTSTVNGLSANFTRDFPAYSISVLELASK
jgi:alpha-L-arabinofuranosidase